MSLQNHQYQGTGGDSRKSVDIVSPVWKRSQNRMPNKNSFREKKAFHLILISRETSLHFIKSFILRAFCVFHKLFITNNQWPQEKDSVSGLRAHSQRPDVVPTVVVRPANGSNLTLEFGTSSPEPNDCLIRTAGHEWWAPLMANLFFGRTLGVIFQSNASHYLCNELQWNIFWLFFQKFIPLWVKLHVF